MDYFDELNRVESHDQLFAICWPSRLGQHPSRLSSSEPPAAVPRGSIKNILLGPYEATVSWPSKA